MRYLLILLLFGCATTEYINVHKPLSIPNICVFEKIPEIQQIYISAAKITQDYNENKDSEMYKYASRIEELADLAGRKVYRNQQLGCEVIKDGISDIIHAHNEIHGDK